jgi:hypothetical protein
MFIYILHKLSYFYGKNTLPFSPSTAAMAPGRRGRFAAAEPAA